MKSAQNPRQRLADARIRRNAFEKYLFEAQLEETEAQLALAIAQRAEQAPTVRPPPPAAADAVDGGWS